MKKVSQNKVRVTVILILVSALVLLLANPALATEIVSDETVVIAAGEVIDDDLIVSGATVEVNGTVTGDLIAAGGEIVVNGEVGGSLFMTGQRLEFNGEVAGSLYGAGFSLVLGPEASVGRNIYFGGFSQETQSGSLAVRDLTMGGYQLIHAGALGGDLNFSGAALVLEGEVGGDVNAEVSATGEGGSPPSFFMPPGVTIMTPGFERGSSAVVGGALEVEETAAPAPPSAAERAARTGGQRVGEFIALLMIGAILLRWWPAVVQRTRAEALERPIASAGWGCLSLIVFAVAVPLATASILALAVAGGLLTFGRLTLPIAGLGGTALAFLGLSFLFTAGLVTKAIVSVLGGRLILARLSSSTLEGRWGNYLSLLLGAFILEILLLIPIVSQITLIIVTLVGLGAIFLAYRDRILPSRKSPPEPAGSGM